MIDLSKIRAKLQHEFFNFSNVEEFEVDIENVQIKFWSEADTLFIQINESQEIEKLRTMLFNLFSIMFLYLGSYPTITLSIIVDDKELDESKLIPKFNTDSNFKSKDRAICSISKETINDKIYHSYLKLNQMPLYSMQYLFSDNYKNIIVTHRITLLLHIIDGVVQDDVIKAMKKEIESEYNIKNKRIGDYASKVYYLCKKYFFEFQNRHNFDILSLLGIKQYELIEIVSDTRNWYSHFLDEDNKKNRLKDGREEWIYLEIIYYLIRLLLADQIGIKINDDWVRKYFYLIHDWICEIRGINVPYKSIAYKINEIYKEWEILINGG